MTTVRVLRSGHMPSGNDALSSQALSFRTIDGRTSGRGRLLGRITTDNRLLAAIWCLWLGFVAGMPYVLVFPEPRGAVSFAGAYGFVALGVLAGLALCSQQGVRDSQGGHRAAWMLVGLAGIALSVLLGLLEMAHLETLGDWLHRAGGIGLPDAIHGVSGFAQQLFEAAGHHERAFAFCLGLVCALSGGALAGAGSHGGAWASGVRESIKSVQGLMALGLAFGCGLIRALAWSWLYPHPAFPLPAVDVFLTAEDLWGSACAYGVVVPITFVAVFSCTLLRVRPSFLPGAMGAYACGELAMRALGRLVPELFEVPLWASVACALCQVVCGIVVVALGACACKTYVRGCSASTPATTEGGQAGQCGVPAPAEVTSERFLACIKSDDVDILAHAGLTLGEVNAVRAAVLGLDSSRAAQMLGVQPSTVRTYRRRVCAKLGLESIDGLAADLVGRKGIFAADDAECAACKQDKQAGSSGKMSAGTIERALPVAGCLGSLLCILLPYGSAPAVWTSLMVVGLGVGFGLLLAAAVPILIKANPQLDSWGKGFPARVLHALGVLVCTFVVALLHVSDASAVMASSLAKVALVFALGICVSHVVWGLACVSASISGRSPHAVPAAVCAAAALCVLVCLDDAAWAAVFSCCMVVSLMGDLFSRSPQETEGDDSAYLVCSAAQNPQWMRAHKAPLLILCTCIGFAWEEAWRGQAFVSFGASCLPFLLACCATLFWAARKHLTWWLGAVLVLSFAGIARFMGLASAMLSCCLCLTVLLCHAVRPTKGPRQSGNQNGPAVCQGAFGDIAPGLLVAMAFGIGVGLYGVNLFGSFLLRMGSPYSQHQLLLTAATVALATALGICALSCMVWLAYCRRLHESQGLLSSSVTPERIRALLAGRGLSKAHVELVALLAEGLSVAETAHRLGYSRCAAYRMRKEAFGTLGVVTQMQLLSYIANTI